MPSNQDEREDILDGLRSLPRIELAILGGIDEKGRWEDGILGRVKKLEEAEAARSKERDRRYTRETAITVSVIGLLLKSLWDWLRGMP